MMGSYWFVLCIQHGDLLVRFMYPTSFFTSKINVFARNKEIPQTSSPLLYISFEFNIAKTFCL